MSAVDPGIEEAGAVERAVRARSNVGKGALRFTPIVGRRGNSIWRTGNT